MPNNCRTRTASLMSCSRCSEQCSRRVRNALPPSYFECAVLADWSRWATGPRADSSASRSSSLAATFPFRPAWCPQFFGERNRWSRSASRTVLSCRWLVGRWNLTFPTDPRRLWIFSRLTSDPPKWHSYASTPPNNRPCTTTCSGTGPSIMRRAMVARLCTANILRCMPDRIDRSLRQQLVAHKSERLRIRRPRVDVDRTLASEELGENRHAAVIIVFRQLRGRVTRRQWDHAKLNSRFKIVGLCSSRER